MAESPPSPSPIPRRVVALPRGSALSPALRTALVDPASWRESLEAFAHSTHLAVALVDATGQPLGPCLNPRPLWSQLHAALGAAGAACPFALVPFQPCTCVRDALARQDLVLVRERTGLVHVTVPLVLDGCPVGALLAGQVFDQYPGSVSKVEMNCD